MRIIENITDGIGGIFSGAQDGVAEEAVKIINDFIGFQPTDPANPADALKRNCLPANDMVWDKRQVASFYPYRAECNSWGGFTFGNDRYSSATRAEIFNGLYGYQTRDGHQNGVLSCMKQWSDIAQNPQDAVIVHKAYSHLVDKANEAAIDFNPNNKWSRAAYILGVYMGMPGMPSVQDFLTPGKGVRQNDTTADSDGLIYSSSTWMTEDESLKMLALCKDAERQIAMQLSRQGLDLDNIEKTENPEAAEIVQTPAKLSEEEPVATEPIATEEVQPDTTPIATTPVNPNGDIATTTVNPNGDVEITLPGLQDTPITTLPFYPDNTATIVLPGRGNGGLNGRLGGATFLPEYIDLPTDVDINTDNGTGCGCGCHKPDEPTKPTWGQRVPDYDVTNKAFLGDEQGRY